MERVGFGNKSGTVDYRARKRTSAGTAFNADPVLGEQMSKSAANEVVAAVLEGMQVDPEWLHRNEGSVDWWAQRLRQRIEYGHSMRHGVNACSFIRATTDCLRDVEESNELYEYIARYNQNAVLSSMVYKPSARKLCLASTVCVAEREPQSGYLLAMHTIALQVAEAYILVDGFLAQGWPSCFKTRSGGAIVDESAHPTSGRREAYDGILRVRGPYLIHGMAETAFQLPWLEAMKALPQSPSVRTTTADNGLTAEFPYGPGPAVPAQPGLLRSRQTQTTLLRMWTSVRHPKFGSGCLVALDIPDLLKDPRVANLLNLWELEFPDAMSLVGSWGWSERGCVGYRSFLPSFMAQECFVLTTFCEASRRSRAIADLVRSWTR